MGESYKDCICYDCEVMVKYKADKSKDDSVDCGCESAPMLLNDCSYCDKRFGCPIPLNPDDSDKEDGFIEGWRRDPAPKRLEPFLIQLEELIHPEYNPKGIEVCYFEGDKEDDRGQVVSDVFVVSHWCVAYDDYHTKIVKPVKWMELPDPGGSLKPKGD